MQFSSVELSLGVPAEWKRDHMGGIGLIDIGSSTLAFNVVGQTLVDVEFGDEKTGPAEAVETVPDVVDGFEWRVELLIQFEFGLFSLDVCVCCL